MIDKNIQPDYSTKEEKLRLHAALPLLAPAIATAIGAAIGLTGTGLVLQKKIQNYFANNPGALDSIVSKFGTKPGDQPEVEEELKELTKPTTTPIKTWEKSFADTGTQIPEKLPESKGLEVPPQEKVSPPGFQKAEPLGIDILTKDTVDETVPKESESKKDLKTNQLSEKELLFLKELRTFGFPESASNTLDQKLKNLSEGKKAKLTKKEADDLSSYSLRQFEGQQGTDEAIFNSTDDLELLDNKLRRIYPEEEAELTLEKIRSDVKFKQSKYANTTDVYHKGKKYAEIEKITDVEKEGGLSDYYLKYPSGTFEEGGEEIFTREDAELGFKNAKDALIQGIYNTLKVEKKAYGGLIDRPLTGRSRDI